MMYGWLIFLISLPQQPNIDGVCLREQTGIEEIEWGSVPEDIPKQLKIYKCTVPDIISKKDDLYVVKCIMNRHAFMDTVLLFFFEEQGRLCSLIGCRYRLGLVAKQAILAFKTPKETSNYFGDVIVPVHGIPQDMIEGKDFLYAEYPIEQQISALFLAETLEIAPYVLAPRYIIILSFYSNSYKFRFYPAPGRIAKGG